MQVLASLKEGKQRLRNCGIGARGGRMHVICTSNSRFKAGQDSAKNERAK
ncbi:MAG: 50S ribosomal protein L36 [Pseudacidovorax sp.]|nr:50S ribosomal protein L36 [Pseudacidovorax sp.]